MARAGEPPTAPIQTAAVKPAMAQVQTARNWVRPIRTRAIPLSVQRFPTAATPPARMASIPPACPVVRAVRRGLQVEEVPGLVLPAARTAAAETGSRKMG